MSFLLTSLSALREDAFVHLNSITSSGLYAERFGQAIVARFGGPEKQAWQSGKDIISLCADFAAGEDGNAAKSALQAYTRKDFSSIDDVIFPTDVPCVIYDAAIGHAWVSADSVGSQPIWYAFEKNQYMVTTDLLVAYRSGFSEPTALGPGQVMLLDVNAHEIVAIETTTPSSTIASSDILQVYAQRAILAAVDAVESTVADAQVTYTLEIDKMDTASLLLACALDALKVDHAVRYTRPRVHDGAGSVQDPAFRRIIGGIPASFMKTQQAAAREESFLAVAAQQWRVCQAAAADPTHPAVLLSFDAGLQPRPVAVYLQNLFCAELNVTVRYPLRDAAFQAALGATQHPTSYFHEALEVLRSPQPLPGISLSNDAAAHMEPFCNSPGHRVREWSLSDLSPCTGNACADAAIQHGDGHSGWKAESRTPHGSQTSKETVIVPNPLLRIHRAARAHASEDGTIVLLLASKGYADMLTNFLCAAHTRSLRNFLVLTHDPEIIDVAEKFGVGVYTPARMMTDAPAPSDADFGTVRYQRLVFSRTELVLELLLAGYQPVIADIDAVWLSNPLLHLPWAKAASPGGVQYDVAITDDSGEVCGCFIALRSTDRAVRFWHEVYVAHRQLIQDALQTGQFLVFDESEQKIVTQLLYKGGYKSELFVYRLPDELFPSGHAYFTLQSHRVQPMQPAVVHNNYIVGEAMKKARFQRHGLWSILQPDDTGNRFGNPVCLQDVGLQKYREVFAGARRNVSIPSLNLYSPIHNSILRDSNNAIVHVSAEGPLSIRINGASADYRFPPANVYVDRNPPAHMAASPAVFADLKMAPAVNHSILAFTVTTRSEDVSINADIGFHREDLSMDRAGRFTKRADDTVLYNQRVSEAEEGPARVSGWTIPYLDPPVVTASEQEENEYFDVKEAAAEALDPMRYSVRVITHNRPQSLQRLLTSLASAQYGEYKNIALYISVDGARGVQDEDQRKRCVEIAEKFHWEFGNKSLKIQTSNIGLKRQWLEVWQPAEDGQEAAFIFEDDMEVSPYYFQSATRAVEKYYVRDVNQRRLHRQLLRAVRTEDPKESDPAEESPVTPLQRFAERAAGKPLLYGVCLQRQYLDANHYPRQLRVRNDHRPFLYSLIGSWGPLMLPHAWRAFLEWQQHRADQPAPETEHLVTNHFATENPRIWTPWHIRFAYETGAKCLYPNLPGRYALVTNHRELGENYAAVAGPDAELVTSAALQDTVEMGLDSTSADLTTTQASAGALHRALWDLPSMSFLATMQYDFNLRRAGALGQDAAYRLSDESGAAGSERAIALMRISGACRWHGAFWAQLLRKTARNLPAWTYSTGITPVHMVLVFDMIFEALPSSARILYLTHTPLIALLPTAANAYRQDIFLQLPREEVDEAWSKAFTAAGYSTRQSLWATRSKLISDVADLKETPYTMLVIELNASLEGPDRVLARIPHALAVPEYILVLGPCTEAATDLEVPFLSAGTGLPTLSEYMMVEDVCAVGYNDVGAVLYRLTSKSDISADQRFMVSRRLVDGFQTRRLVSAAGLL